MVAMLHLLDHFHHNVHIKEYKDIFLDARGTNYYKAVFFAGIAGFAKFTNLSYLH